MKFDKIIIGFGKAGKTLAVLAANKGEKVALIEKSPKMYGGTCINIACIPTKVLAVAASENLTFEEAISQKFDVVQRLNSKNYNMLADNESITVFDGFGSFLDENTILVESNDEKLELSADKIIINTGAESSIPKISGIEEGLKDSKILTSTELLDNQEAIDGLAIIGGGFIGLEFASTFAKLGTKVTIFERGDKILANEDDSMQKAIFDFLVSQGVNFEFNANIEAFENVENGILVQNNGKKSAFNKVLISTGRKPVTAKLNLERAGIKTLENGGIWTNENLQTSNSKVWAVGDVRGKEQFTYTSLDDFRILRSQFYGDGKYSLKNRVNLPNSIFLQVPFSKVGLTEKQALEEGFKIKIKEIPAAAVPKLQLEFKTTGLLRAIVDSKTNKILGAALFCYNSPEVINIIKTAIDTGLDYTVLRDQIFTHPTVAESLNDLFNL
ncbi:MAG: FAD-dependent oxidoreductase [Candidatus Saccharimonas sp.]|nr:MAG: FAD-dependent oxidoreductase [Candidatus Saccharimonas sp.]